ncbi:MULTISPECIES: hypothetical protein [unclassified Vibrio]|uniref:hypothetical protein n=1 Tax=unclassified Vibrio TaxID=2614977 RepID=UPI001361E58A|nr:MULTISPECIES: hypothetical protein [unclassified Vibrio]NAW59896.1 hypothetical protein [Vibrio sp. V36_P2S2PM302]NAX26677.1 hypothetical protein [Vibrio sp. V38_P2S17PM301]NAX29947.1 hypothetical protein [Vibrio sp. V37_P2S8PM304]
MRQRIGVEQLKSPLSDGEIEQALAAVEKAVSELDKLDPAWLSFCRDKSILAIENLSFFLRQWLRLHQQGYPSTENDYLRIIERQMGELKQVYVALYKLAPGLVYELQQQAPEVFVWLMLSAEFGQEKTHLLSGLSTSQDISREMACMLVVQSKLMHLDLYLAGLVDGKTKLAKDTFDYLRLRQTLSVSLSKRWLKEGMIPERTVHPVLATFDVADSIEWMEENLSGEQNLFERLLVKQDRNTWFRQYFGIQPDALPSEQVNTFAKLLELKEFMQFDLSSPHAPFHLALTGDPEWAYNVLAALQDMDEEDGERWLDSLHVVYGESFPLNPTGLGVDYEWQDALEILDEWVSDGHHQLHVPARLGFALSYDSTLAALQTATIPETYRIWLWRQLCLHARVYIPWHATMPEIQQAWIISKLKEIPSASERFNLRSHHATVGY